MDENDDPRFDERGFATERALSDLAAYVRAWVEEDFQERAAIMEYDGNLPRPIAELQATNWSAYGRLIPEETLRAWFADPAQVPD